MNLELKISTDSLKEHIEKFIREEVRSCLENQLDDIVAGEMAKMKLFKPGTSDLASMITRKVDTACARALAQPDLKTFMLKKADARVEKAATLIAVVEAKAWKERFRRRANYLLELEAAKD